MSDPLYEPNSFNALAGRILERLDQQDSTLAGYREEVKEQTKVFTQELARVSGRVTTLEESAWKQRGVVAAIALAVPAAWHWVSSGRG